MEAMGFVKADAGADKRTQDLFSQDLKLVQFKMPEELRRQLKVWAAQHDMSMYAAINEAIKRMLETPEK